MQPRLRLNRNKVELCTVHLPHGLKFRSAPRALAILLSLPMVAWAGCGAIHRLAHCKHALFYDYPSRRRRKTPPRKHKPVHHASRAARVAHTARIKRAFVASTELRPMAQQLATLRTPEAYAGVAAYAHSHTGDAAAAAYLALGHAYLLDKRYADAETALAAARHADGELADYSDFLDAEASHDAGDDPAAEAILHGFTDRYPESIFDRRRRPNWRPMFCSPWAI